MSLQVTRCLAFIVALGATEWLITSLDFFTFLQVTRCLAFIVALGATEWLITRVDFFMSLQVTRCLASIVALGATEWLITSVDFFHFPSCDPMFVYSLLAPILPLLTLCFGGKQEAK